MVILLGDADDGEIVEISGIVCSLSRTVCSEKKKEYRTRKYNELFTKFDSIYGNAVKGELHPNRKLACFVCYLNTINNYHEVKICRDTKKKKKKKKSNNILIGPAVLESLINTCRILFKSVTQLPDGLLPIWVSQTICFRIDWKKKKKCVDNFETAHKIGFGSGSHFQRALINAIKSPTDPFFPLRALIWNCHPKTREFARKTSMSLDDRRNFHPNIYDSSRYGLVTKDF